LRVGDSSGYREQRCRQQSSSKASHHLLLLQLFTNEQEMTEPGDLRVEPWGEFTQTSCSDTGMGIVPWVSGIDQ